MPLLCLDNVDFMTFFHKVIGMIFAVVQMCEATILWSEFPRSNFNNLQVQGWLLALYAAGFDKCLAKI